MTNRTAAHRYARALLDVAVHERADLEAIEEELAAFARLLAGHPQLREALLNPVVPAQRRHAVVVQLAARAGASQILSKLLGLLATRDRLVLVPELLSSYRDLRLDYRKIVRAEVTTATQLDPDATESLEQRLRQATGRTVSLQMRVDPSIIGGLIAKVGSTVYDGSVTTQLQNMRERLEG